MFKDLDDGVKGIFYTIISAIVFGAVPMMTKSSFGDGANAITVTFCRGFFPIPILLLVLRYLKIDIRISIKELKNFFVLCFFGTTAATVTVYSSINYIPTGVATTIHFTYPVIITLAGVLFFKEEIRLIKTIALISAMLGVFLLTGGISSGSIIGFALAGISGVFYAFYMIYVERAGLKKLHFLKFAFYVSVMNTVITFTIGTVTDTLVWNLSFNAWLKLFILSLSVVIGGISFLQMGIRYIGASMASILCTFEPITSVILGILVFREEFTFKIFLGVVLILLAVVVISVNEKRLVAEAEIDLE